MWAIRGTATPPIHSWKWARIGRSFTIDVKIAEKLGDGESEGDHLVHFAVVGRDLDAVVLPHQVLVVVETAIAAAIVDEDHARAAGDEPAAEVAGHAGVFQFLQRFADRAVGGLLLEFQRRRWWGCRGRSGNSDRPSVRAWWRLWSAGRCRCRPVASRLPTRTSNSSGG